MKRILVFGTIIILFGCSADSHRQNAITDQLAAELKELKEKSHPELSQIMNGIQMHHAKLWYAGINNNWKLSAYQVEEIKELIEEAGEMELSRPEVRTISMIYPAIDSLENSITAQNPVTFKKHFQLLTNSCNKCHIANDFGFNRITIPTAPPVFNQDFNKPLDDLKAEN